VLFPGLAANTSLCDLGRHVDTDERHPTLRLPEKAVVAIFHSCNPHVDLIDPLELDRTVAEPSLVEKAMTFALASVTTEITLRGARATAPETPSSQDDTTATYRRFVGDWSPWTRWERTRAGIG
jgi:hypothetical protein